MPEPTIINKIPFHRKEIITKEQKLLDDLYYILDSSTTSLERLSVNMCITKVKEYVQSISKI